MIRPVGRREATIHFAPGRLNFAGLVVGSVIGWLLVLVALVEIVVNAPYLGWIRGPCLLILYGSPQFAMWSTRRFVDSRRLRAAVPASLVQRRHHGTIAAITDSERRPLRPIGYSVVHVAMDTGRRLAELMTIPNIVLFRGIRVPTGDAPPTAHAVVSGRTLILIESVAWPPGHYAAGVDGRVSCDGVYIGQSVAPLVAAVCGWRARLPRRHLVRAVVVVHQSASGPYELPAAARGGVAWAFAENAVGEIRQLLPSGGQAVSRPAVAALVAATTEPA
jgi:hypothetical protein